MRNLSLGMLAWMLVLGAAIGQEPMPLQVMPNSPAGRTYYNPAPSWQAPPPAPAMAYPAVYPAVWQFGPNPNAMAMPAYQNEYLPNPGMVMGPPLQGAMMLQPMPLSPPKGLVQTKGQSVSCAPPPPPACGPICEPVCCPPPACDPPEPYLYETSPWQPARINRYYAMGDYLLWWTEKQPVPVEADVGFPDFTLPANGPRNGARLTVGAWLNPAATLALEASGFWLQTRTATTSVTQGPNPDANQLPFFLGTESQTSSVQATTELWGAEVDARYKIWETSGASYRGYVDFLAGFRYMNLSEGLTFTNSTLFSVAPVLFSGARVDSTDWVGTHNQFYAPQFGIEAGTSIGRVSVNLYSKIALGINSESVNMAGQAVVTAPPLPLGNLTAPGGLLVQAPGQFSQEVFSYMPEAGLNLGFRLTEFCQIGAGYSFLYLGNVVRPGDHFPASTGAQFPASIFTVLGGPAVPQPAFTFSQTNFWAQGGNFRITFIF